MDQLASDMAVAALADPSRVCLPPIERSRGTSPSQAARLRDMLNWTPLPTAARERRRR